MPRKIPYQFTPVPTSLLLKLCEVELPASAWRVLTHLLLLTVNWNTPHKQISVSTLDKRCGLSHNTLFRALRCLRNAEIISWQEGKVSLSFKNGTTHYQNWNSQVPKMGLNSNNFDTGDETKIPPNSASYKGSARVPQNPTHTYNTQKNNKQKYRICEVDYLDALEECRQKLLAQLAEEDKGAEDGEKIDINTLMKEFRQKLLAKKQTSPAIRARMLRILKEKKSKKEKA